jgi:hypothetical protein
MKEYYNDNTRVSNSSLSWFLTSPKYFKAMLDGDIEQEEQSYFKRGQKIHMYLLEPKEFFKHYTVTDIETPKSENERQFCLDFIASNGATDGEKALEAYKKNYSYTGYSPELLAAKGLDKVKKLKRYINHTSELLSGRGTEIIRPAEREWFENIAKSVKQHKKANELIYPVDDPLTTSIEVLTEFRIDWDFEHSYHGINLPCKGLIDRFIIDHDNKTIKLVDLKTTSTLGEFANGSFVKYNYGRQLTWYWDAINNYILNRPDKDTLMSYARETYIVGVSTDRKLCQTEVFRINDDVLIKNKEIIREIVEKLSWHWVNDQWEHSREYYEGDGTINITGEMTP